MAARPRGSQSSSNDVLTAKQAEVLRVIEESVARTGRPPTYRDIARICDYDAVGTVQDHVRALIRKGFLRRESGVARGLELAHRIPSLDIPILGTVPAGSPIEAFEANLGSLTVPVKWKGDLFALRVKGDSMIDAGIHEGDYVIVRKQLEAHNGEIVVAMIDGEATVKFLEKKHGKTRLLPANPRYSPIEIPLGSENSVQGKVVSVQRFY